VKSNSAIANTLKWPSQLELGSAACHVWFVFQDQVRDAMLLDRYRQLLTEPERAGESRFHFPEDRHRYLLTRALVRSVLSLYAPIRPAEWSFRINAHGRPEIDPAMPAAGLSFNVSHTRGLVMMGVSRQGAIGVDTENVSRSPASMEMAEQFCSRSEIAELRSESDDYRRLERLLDFWTLKEAYVKARGMGFSIPLDQISFSLPGSRGIEPAFDGSIHDQSDHLAFWMMCPSPDHKAAVCVSRSGGPTLELAVRSAIPLVMHQTMVSAITRQSE
jgi:4'-phosphopantetheinyl transferase